MAEDVLAEPHSPHHRPDFRIYRRHSRRPFLACRRLERGGDSSPPGFAADAIRATLSP